VVVLDRGGPASSRTWDRSAEIGNGFFVGARAHRPLLLVRLAQSQPHQVRDSALGPWPRRAISAPILTRVDGRARYDVTRDERRFLPRPPITPRRPSISVPINWTEK
jgi:hypothetical protein